ncbi:MAG: glycosyltransferase family 2 protein [Anaerolineae bacterium]|nr:glycosyltransferase family 2 protein [Anaerolineae bacterium]
MSAILSIIIPTHNRTTLLLRVLESLYNQSAEIGNRLEIIVVDDGSTEAVEAGVEAFIEKHKCNALIRYFHQVSSGPAAARNFGIHEAKGDVVLFLGDDIIALPGLLEKHLFGHTVEHQETDIAILGIAELALEFLQTPFARWWRRWNFRYHLLLEGKRNPDFSFFYTNNISLKRQFLLDYGVFDESFRYAAYEDGELGARLTKCGLQIIFEPAAQAVHYHEINLYTACRRMLTRGRSYDLFVQKTGLLGLSRIWSFVGAGPWMHPVIVRPLYRLADKLQYRTDWGLLYIVVLMYCFNVGRGRKPAIPEIL